MSFKLQRRSQVALLLTGSERFGELPMDSLLVAKSWCKTKIQTPEPMFLPILRTAAHLVSPALINGGGPIGGFSGFRSPWRATAVFDSTF